MNPPVEKRNKENLNPLREKKENQMYLQDLHFSRDLNLQKFANFRQFIFQQIDKI